MVKVQLFIISHNFR